MKCVYWLNFTRHFHSRGNKPYLIDSYVNSNQKLNDMKKCFVTVACLVIYPLLVFSEVQHLNLMVHFDTDRHEVKPEAEVMIRSFLSDFSPDDDIEITVVGHTDFRGSDAYNMALAERRCKSVLAYIKSIGFNDVSIDADWHGKRTPIARGTNSQSLQRNRRVEIKLKKHIYHSLEDVYELLGAENKHEFVIRPDEPTRLVCAKGSEVMVPANALVYADGSPCTGEVTVRVTEALDYQSFFAAKLSTISDGRPLVSGGMMNFSATDSDGVPLEIRDSEQVFISLPADSLDAEMTLFLSDNGSNWNNTNTPPLSLQNRTPVNGTQPILRLPRWTPPRKVINIPPRPAVPPVPVRPEEPVMTKAESTSKFRWWQFIKKYKARKSPPRINAERLTKHYLRKYAKYEKRLARYFNDSLTYNDRMENWELRMQAWNDQLDSAEAYYAEVTYPAALERYEVLVNQLYADYGVDLSEWRAENALSAIQSVYATQFSEDIRIRDQYLYAVNAVGWYNCDRFMNLPKSKKEEVYVSTSQEQNRRVIAMFTDENSCLDLFKDVNGYFTFSFPKQSNFVLISCYVEDDKFMVGTSFPPFDNVIDIDHRQMKLSEFTQMVNNFSRQDLASR